MIIIIKKTWCDIKKDLDKWRNLPLSLLGRISVIKMNVLPRMLFLFQAIPIISSEKPFRDWQKELSNFIWQGRKPRIKFKNLTDSKERGGLNLPNLELYYNAACFVWIKDWLTLSNSYILKLEGHDLIFGWHAYLWFGKIGAHQSFKNHCIRRALFRVWNKYRKQLWPKIPYWVSPHEALYGREILQSKDYLTYKDLIEHSEQQIKFKKREDIASQWYM